MELIEEENNTINENTINNSSSISLLEPSSLIEYLIKVCPPALDAENEKEINDFFKIIKSNHVLPILEKFIGDTKQPVLVVQKISNKGNILKLLIFNIIYYWKR